MNKARDRGALDWLIEVAGASAPALAAGFAAARLSPLYGWPTVGATLIGGGATFALAFVAMRLVPADARHLVLPDFDQSVVLDDVLLLDEILLDEIASPRAHADEPFAELLLDTVYLAPAVMAAAADAVAELLLDDPLPSPAPDSRVVQLFADGRMPTAGQLKQRIDRHLADSDRPLADRPPATDASDALSEALAELRRSLRQA